MWHFDAAIRSLFVQDNAVDFLLPLRQQPAVSLLNLLGRTFSLVIGKTDESVSLRPVPAGPLYRIKQDRQKQLRGICTMQYFQSFIIVLFLFFPF